MNNEMKCENVAIRNFPIATNKFAYISIKDYDGAVMMKEDIEKLRDWCDTQLTIWDSPEDVPNLTRRNDVNE